MIVKQLSVICFAVLIMTFTIIGSQYVLGQAPGVKFLSSSSYIDAADILHVVGEVQNISPSVLRFVQVVGTFYDSSNRVVGTSNTYTNPADLSPGDKAPFDLTVLSASVPVREIHNYGLTASSIDLKIPAHSENDTPLSGSNNMKASEGASVSLPLSKEFVNGKTAYFTVTDASDPQIVSSISATTNFKVNYSPALADTDQSSRQQVYVFINGVKGGMEPQLIVATALPKDKGYSPLYNLNYVQWNTDPRVLKSVDEILSAEKSGELTISKSNIVIDSPAVTSIH